ncbi:MAG: hypothetical protein H0V81_03635 [Solirubrobacterales bacterium]|nr:hypothetical protein [Solirubrobacterales bacterium]
MSDPPVRLRDTDPSSEAPTRVHDDAPPRAQPGGGRRPSVGSWVSLALATACGFLLGALVITTVGGGDVTTTETQVRTVTAPAGTAPQGGTVITRTRIPALVGERLDVARERAERSRFDLVIGSGGGLFGVQIEENWEVVAQRPAAEELIEQGSTIRVDIERR